MKKLMALLLSVLLTVPFVACGDEGGDESLKVDDSSAVSQKEEDIAFEEQIVVDNDKCLIKITGIDADNLFGYTLNVYLENKSEDTPYLFTVNKAVVNGVDCPVLLYVEVDPGSNTDYEVTLMDTELKEYGVGDYTDIILYFTVEDANNIALDPVVEENVHVYPLGKDKATKFSRKPKDTDVVLADESEVKVTVIDYKLDDVWGYTIVFFVENNSDKDISVSSENESLNGVAFEPLFANSVPAKCSSFETMCFYNDFLENNSIETVEEIKFILKGNEDATWSSLFEKEITLNPQA
ncbi:MAG: hypothetical protein IJB76_04995 [Clostridia bacterium]|nr:hypothetical protein [Clostridia bacterium]